MSFVKGSGWPVHDTEDGVTTRCGKPVVGLAYLLHWDTTTVVMCSYCHELLMAQARDRELKP